MASNKMEGKMKADQYILLLEIHGWIKAATDNGLFDELCKWTHPDVINNFCDAIDDVLSDLQQEGNHDNQNT